MSLNRREKIFAALGTLESELLSGEVLEMIRDPVAHAAMIQARASLAATKVFVHEAFYALDRSQERPKR